MLNTLKTKAGIVAIFTLALSWGPLAEATENAPASTATHNYSINYDDWQLFLSGAVLRAKPSVRPQNTSRRNKSTGTRLGGAKRQKAHDANRIDFKALNQQHLARLAIIQSELAAVPAVLPLESFSDEERLAYWLNLRNISIVIKLAQNYPVKKLNKLIEADNGLFDSAAVTVAGRSMSINDMTVHILNNWKDPLTIYGLFEGTVGSPSLRHKPYTGETVYQDLRYNARDFVNSQRGLKIFGKKARISEFYLAMQQVFPELESGLVDHIREFARNETILDMDSAKSFAVNQYDWTLTDIKKRMTYRGGRQKADSNLLAIFANGETSEADQGGVSDQTIAMLQAAEMREKKRVQFATITVEDYTGKVGGRVRGR